MEDISGITNAVYQGVGLGILAGVSMHTLKVIEKNLSHDKRRSKKYKKGNPYNYWIK